MTKDCPNLNHQRSNSPVRFCPMCGEVVNGDLPIKRCSDKEHAKLKRDREMFCVQCGEQLIE
jgi:hypothetical protein